MSWWPFGKKKTPVEKWLDAYEKWLNKVGKLMGEFPDHAVLDGVQFTEREANLLADIAVLYSENTRELLEQMVLKGAQLRWKQQLPEKTPTRP